MLNYNELTFDLDYAHVRAHQDNEKAFHLLSGPSQMNCIADGHAKRVIWELDGDELPPQKEFPLEAVAVFVGQKKMASDAGNSLCFWTYLRLAISTFFTLGVMSGQGFDEVAWRQVYNALHSVPRLFQLWACKQVMGEAGTNLNQHQYMEDMIHTVQVAWRNWNLVVTC